MERKPNYFARIRMVKAMEEIIRNLNDEGEIERWLIYGVADGDISENTPDEDLMFYVENDERFADLMNTFAKIMKSACKTIKGTFYCDYVCSHEEIIED